MSIPVYSWLVRHLFGITCSILASCLSVKSLLSNHVERERDALEMGLVSQVLASPLSCYGSCQNRAFGRVAQHSMRCKRASVGKAAHVALLGRTSLG